MANDDVPSPPSWKASITFPVYPVHTRFDDMSEVATRPPVAKDICSFLNGGQSACGNNRLYFCPIKYPPPSEGEGKGTKGGDARFRALDRDLKRAAKDAGSPLLIGRGGKRGKQGSWTYRCTYCYRLDKPSKLARDAGGENTVCPFNFAVSYDEHGFFVTLYNQAGNAEHVGHPPMYDDSGVEPDPANAHGEAEGECDEESRADDSLRQRLNPLLDDIMDVHALLKSKACDEELEELLKDHLVNVRRVFLGRRQESGSGE